MSVTTRAVSLEKLKAVGRFLRFVFQHKLKSHEITWLGLSFPFSVVDDFVSSWTGIFSASGR